MVRLTMKLNMSDINCGVYQLSGLSGTVNTAGREYVIDEIKTMLLNKTVMKEYEWVYAHARPPAIIFSGHVDGPIPKFVDYIIEKGYGNVEESMVFTNTSVLSHDCRIWIWFLDYKALGIEKLLNSYK